VRDVVICIRRCVRRRGGASARGSASGIPKILNPRRRAWQQQIADFSLTRSCPGPVDRPILPTNRVLPLPLPPLVSLLLALSRERSNLPEKMSSARSAIDHPRLEHADRRASSIVSPLSIGNVLSIDTIAFFFPSLSASEKFSTLYRA
jgi:hypothetical protein